MKKGSLFIFLLTSAFWLASCSKAPKNAINTTPQGEPKLPAVVPQPFPNTVDKMDTLNVMAYNVLNYGDGCQGSTTVLNGYFKTIIQYTNPDLLSCEKMVSFPLPSALPANLADKIRDSVLNTVFPGRYDYATPTNVSGGDKMSVLFYNKQKLTFVKTETLLAYITDFDLYKLYYNDPNIAVTHDTTFLYVLVNHTQSGSSSSTRDMQVAQQIQSLKKKFAYFPNLIMMGDFNTHSSYEAGYQSIITSSDTTTKMSDPPFWPDQTVKYPAQWQDNARGYAAFLTTTTREGISYPNACGTNGGAKSWFDHIFISPWLVSGVNYLKYIPNSYQTIGNDGNRLGADINSTTPGVNTSAPANVLNALFQFSDKYPITIKLRVKANRNAYSITDPAERN